jgi:titin
MANVISSNAADGVLLNGSGASGNLIEGDYIGTDSNFEDHSNGSEGIFINAVPNNTIGGVLSEGGVQGRNYVDYNAGPGIQIDGSGATGNVVAFNDISHNRGDGILIHDASTNTVGLASTDWNSNYISDNDGGGIHINGTDARGNLVQNNVIGASEKGLSGNTLSGVLIEDGSGTTVGGTTPGTSNLISGNRQNGVTITGSGTGDSVLGNSISGNGKLGIDLGNDGVTLNDSLGHTGPNQLLDFPVLTLKLDEKGNTTTAVTGTVHGPAQSTLRIEFFANSSADPSGYGQGEMFLGSDSVPTDANGDGSFSSTISPNFQGMFISATATDAAGDTSEFARDILLPVGPVKITLAPPSAPMLAPADSDGSPGGETTTSTSPHLIGTTIPSATVGLLDASGTVINITQADSTGRYAIQVPGPLVPGSHVYRVNVTDQYGDVSGPSAPLTITVVNPTLIPPALVTVTGIRDVTTKKHQVTEVIVTFSGAVNAAEAQDPAIYRLATSGKKGSFTARDARMVALKSEVYNASNDTVTLIPRKPFALTKPVQLQVNGLPPSGLRDSLGRYIDGGHTGTPGSNAVALLSRGGATVEARAVGTTGGQAFGIAAMVDTLLEAGDLIAATRIHRVRHAARLTAR